MGLYFGIVVDAYIFRFLIVLMFLRSLISSSAACPIVRGDTNTFNVLTLGRDVLHVFKCFDSTKTLNVTHVI